MSESLEATLRVLIVDDERTHAETVADALESRGHQCTIATSGKQAIQQLDADDELDLVLTDLRLGDMDGLAIVRKVRRDHPEAEVMVVTGYGEVKSAVEAIKMGASHYLLKPLDLGELRAMVDKSGERVRLARLNRELRQQLDEKFGFEGVIGNSAKMHDVLARLKQFAPRNMTVLILGENGTGKELAAKALHTNSPRRNKSFVAMNCAALNENLLDDELFGHEAGAFTGAERVRKGRFEHAHHGTLFLDEVGDMPLPLQAKLLRVLENSEVVRIGSNEPLKVDVRIIAATNRDLAKSVDEGKFRQDLYYRLRVGTLRMPSLRDRKEDIPLLATHFLKEFSHKHDKKISGMTESVRKAFAVYDWPGNVRELRNTVESMVVQDLDGVLNLDDLPEGDGIRDADMSDANRRGIDSMIGRTLAEIERYYSERTLEMAGGNREAAANTLGIGERTLYRMIQDWKLQDQIQQALAKSNGDIGIAAEMLEMTVESLERKLKKLGRRDD